MLRAIVAKCNFSCGIRRFADRAGPVRATGTRGLLLIDAVREALKQNANTLLQQQQLAFDPGQVLTQQGAFDPIASVMFGRQRISTTLPGWEEDQIIAGGITNVFQQKTIANTNLFGINKLLSNGMTVGASYGVTSTQTTSTTSSTTSRTADARPAAS